MLFHLTSAGLLLFNTEQRHYIFVMNAGRFVKGVRGGFCTMGVLQWACRIRGFLIFGQNCGKKWGYVEINGL